MDTDISRFKTIRNIIVGMFIIMVIASVRLQIVEGKKYYRLSEENRIRKQHIPAPRGKIFDRHGVEIANTRPGFYVSVIQAITDDKTIQELTTILNINEKEIKEKMRIEKNLFMPVKIAHDISYRQLSIIEENMDVLKGVQVGVEPLRNYPQSEILCHLLGYVGEITQGEMESTDDYNIDDYIGRMGLEEYYEDHLKGTDGIEYIEVNALGREISKITEKRPTDAVYGADLHTTVDCALTESVAVFLTKYPKAACVCLIPENGEILVLYSKPGFDPNIFVHGLQEKEWELLNNTPDAPMYNRAIMSCYPCGSTFKPFIALAALDSKMVTKDKCFIPCRGQFRLGNRLFGCWKIHRKLNLVNAIIHSCDIYFYQLGRFIGIDTISTRLSKMGFGQKTNIDLPNEKCGCSPDREWFEKKYGKNWTEGHIFNLSIGQGDLLVTPLQLACAYCLMANTGEIPVPHIVKKDDYEYFTPGISKEAIETVNEGLCGVVSRGTGTLARIAGYMICGKTGTVENPHGEDHSIFVGFAPREDPQILVCLFIENAGHGGSVAAPIAGRIMNLYLNR